jgi:hypothetical protein
MTGTIELQKFFANSKLDLKTRFSFSQNVMTNLAILDAILKPGKQADGTFHYNLNGNFGGPLFMPSTQ